MSLAVLAVVTVAAVLIARHPQHLHAMTARAREPVARWLRHRCAAVNPRRWPRLARWLAPERAAGLAVVAGMLAVFALAAGFAYLLDTVLDGEGIAAVDRPASAWTARHREAALTAVLRVVTEAGSPAGVAVLALLVGAGLAWRRRSWLPIAVGVVGLGGIGLVISGVKALVGRDRPPLPYALIVEDGFSFPSGHATGTTVVMVLSAWMVTRWQVRTWAWQVAVWTLALTLVGAVGLSRVYLGVHYPSDVIAGWLLGAAWSAALAVAVTWAEHARRARTDLPTPMKGSSDVTA